MFRKRLMVFALLLGMMLPSSAAVDNSRSYLFLLSANGKTEVSVQKGDILTVSLNLSRNDAPSESMMYAMQDEIYYDSTLFQLVQSGIIVSSGIKYIDLSRNGNTHALYMNFASMDGGELWQSDRLIGVFQLKVIGDNVSTWLRNTNYLVSTQNGENVFSCKGKDLKVIIGNGGFVRLPIPDAIAHPVVFRVKDNGEIVGVRALTHGKELFAESSSDENLQMIPAAEFPIPFTDVPDSEWYRASVGYVYANSLFQGMTETSFEPQTVTNRAMVMMILYRLEQPDTVGSSVFSDVPNGSWYTEAVNWAASVDIARGFEDGSFHPMEAVTREQLAAFFYRYMQYKGIEDNRQAELTGYEDAGRISNWALGSVRWANARGLITGRTETALVPRDSATRAEFATILMRYLESSI